MPNKKSNTSHQKPYQVYNLKGKSRMIILCDHASNHIPYAYRNLGLGKKEILFLPKNKASIPVVQSV